MCDPASTFIGPDCGLGPAQPSIARRPASAQASSCSSDPPETPIPAEYLAAQ